jgi:branched-chain amino acid transport system ATP-binding protein
MLLELEGVSLRFGAVVAADAIDLRVAEGEAVGIIGANGAGKSSLFNLIAGVLRPDSGAIRLHGRDVTKVPARLRCAAGIGRSFQIPRPFAGLTTFENLLAAARGERGATAMCGAILERTGLIAKANAPAGRLTLLERKRLELARALATRPEILLLDEIAGGLTEAECRVLIDLVKSLAAERITILWVEHIVHALMSVASRLIVLEFGRKIADGEPRAVMDDPNVRRSYLGIG